MEALREGRYNVLVATCIAEEGLDIGDVDLIVHYDVISNTTRQVEFTFLQIGTEILHSYVIVWKSTFVQRGPISSSNMLHQTPSRSVPSTTSTQHEAPVLRICLSLHFESHRCSVTAARVVVVPAVWCSCT